MERSLRFTQVTKRLSFIFHHTSQELDLLTEETKVYKLVGPVLMAVDLDESKSNVEKRLEFIESELKKLDNSIATKQGEQATIGEEVSKLQAAMQADTAQAVKEIVG